MEYVHALISRVRVRRSALTVLGACAGYAWYAFIGCDRGCPITGHSWSSTAYGALIGLLIEGGLPRRAHAPASNDKNGTGTNG